jgi:hypothetical protein
MTRKPATRRNQPPATSRGGAITFQGVEYATEAELEQALTAAVVEAGWRVTPAGAAYLAGVRDGQSGKVA